MTPTDQELRDTRAMVINEKAIEAIVDLSQAVTELTKAVRKLDTSRQPNQILKENIEDWHKELVAEGDKPKTWITLGK